MPLGVSTLSDISTYVALMVTALRIAESSSCVSCFCESYITPEVSEKIDEVMKEYRAGKCLAIPFAADEIELKMSA